jgi:phosphatidylinositol-3-phosphatase
MPAAELQMNRPQRCLHCAAPLAHDQRYCVECGTRRGPLPAHLEHVLAAIVGSPAGSAAEAAAPIESEESAFGFALVGGLEASPRAVAVAVLGMLSFGVVVGSLAGSGNIGLPPGHGTLVALEQPVSPPADLSSTSDSSGTSSGSTGGGSSSSGGSSGSGAVSSASTTSGATSSGSSGSSSTTPTTAAFTGPLPPVKHVFLIVLTGHGFSQTFSQFSKDRYLSSTLAKQGEVVQDFYASTTGSLGNEIALISGQGPTPQTNANCAAYSAITPASLGSFDQVLGSGCVYPTQTQTLADQLTAQHKTWKAYVEGIDQGPAGQPKACRHPTLGAADAAQQPRPGDPYVTWRNPFVYFQSITGGRDCATSDVGLGQLATDLKASASTPSLSYIVPSPCDDGSDTPCAPNAPAGLPEADTFLQKIVPEITASPAYKADGLLVITFDQAPQTGQYADQSACCDNPTFPNLPASTTAPTVSTPGATTSTSTASAPSTSTPATSTPTTSTPTTSTPTTSTPTTSTPTTSTPTTSTPTTTSPSSSTTGGATSTTGGGGQVGLLLISPYVKPGSSNMLDNFDDFSLLASIEKLFKLKPLGYAADPNLALFDASIYNINSPG